MVAFEFHGWICSGAARCSTVLTSLIAHFVASCVEQFAQSQATFEHNAAILAEARRLQAAHATTNSR